MKTLKYKILYQYPIKYLEAQLPNKFKTSFHPHSAQKQQRQHHFYCIWFGADKKAKQTHNHGKDINCIFKL